MAGVASGSDGATNIGGNTAHQQNKYLFNCVGTVKEINYPNKAVVVFRPSGQGPPERALLLLKSLITDPTSKESQLPQQQQHGKPPDENRRIEHYLKESDTVTFDCHIYDKGGGVAQGKDRCKYYVTKAVKGDLTKNTSKTDSSAVSNGSHNQQPQSLHGQGWISELQPRKGVLTLEQTDGDVRISFFANKLYLAEKKFGTKQSLLDHFSEGDYFNFEAVPQQGSPVTDGRNNNYCMWFAILVWKGTRPKVDESGSTVVSNPPPVGAPQHKGDPSISNNANFIGVINNEEQHISANVSQQQSKIVNGPVNEYLIRGVGKVAKIFTERHGVIWWLKRPNHWQSVWFESKKTFVFGVSQADKNLFDVLAAGDPVLFIAEKPQDPKFSTKWIAKQVLIDESALELLKAVSEPPKFIEDDNEKVGNATEAFAKLSV